MGQAKSRGSFEERKAQAVIRNEAQEVIDAKHRILAKEKRNAEREARDAERIRNGGKPRPKNPLVGVSAAALLAYGGGML
jgi:hypothetical protein